VAQRCRDAIAQRGWGMWALEISGVMPFAGFVGLNAPHYDAPWSPAVEIGWRLARAAWGQGLATEAAKAALDFGFTRLMLREIVAITVPGNAPSRRVMERWAWCTTKPVTSTTRASRPATRYSATCCTGRNVLQRRRHSGRDNTPHTLRRPP
jgi:Acetyltransferase (GNAT) domain